MSSVYCLVSSVKSVSIFLCGKNTNTSRVVYHDVCLFQFHTSTRCVFGVCVTRNLNLLLSMFNFRKFSDRRWGAYRFIDHIIHGLLEYIEDLAQYWRCSATGVYCVINMRRRKKQFCSSDYSIFFLTCSPMKTPLLRGFAAYWDNLKRTGTAKSNHNKLKSGLLY